MTPGVKANVENIYPLTPLQEGLLFHALLDPGSPAYFQQLSWTIRGHLDLADFETSWNAMVRRHGALRTIFVHEGTDRPLQVVLRDRPLAVTVVDLRRADGDPHARAAAFRQRERAKPFDLSRDPLLRVAVLRLGDDHDEIVWSHHHIILDGWSVGLVLGELLQAYAAIRNGRPLALPPVTPFSRYVKWLQARDRETSARFWDTVLAGDLEWAVVPHGSAGRTKTAERAWFTFDVDVETTRKLRRLASGAGVTLATVLEAAWAVLLARYSGRADVVFGAVVSGRPAEVPGIERMVGNFINTVPVRVEVRPETTFPELLARRQQAALAAEPHHHVALSGIQARHRRTDGLFGTLAAIANYPVDVTAPSAGDGSDPGFVVEDGTHFEQTHYDLDLQFMPSDGLRVRIGYASSLYAAAQIRAIEGHFTAVLRAMLAAEPASVGSVDLLSASERLRLLGDLQERPAPCATEETLAEAFEAQVRRTPDRTAVVAAGERLTYRELDERTNRVARHLRDVHGIRPDDRIALLLDRGLEMAVGMLAALKAGGAYVPLEPSLPHERIRHVLADSGCRVVLASAATADLARLAAGTPVVDLDAVPDGSTATLEASAGGRHLAYVIYTSGSTGRPKGAMIEHRSVLNLVQGLRALVYDRYSGPLRVALVASYAFDASVQQIFAALLLGHTLVIVDDATKRDVAALNRFLLDRAVDVMDGTPTLLGLMAQADGFAAVRRRVRLALVGGEPLAWSLVATLGLDPETMVITNVYGPTECCVDATAYTIGAVPSDAAGTVPIGRPLPNVQVVVLDGTGHLAPVGVPGEIHIGGAGMGRGYLNDRELTEAKFVPSPFRSGERMYRTADAGRWLPDGTLEYLGRLDDQVKVRGHRIELGEIEHHLRLHPAIVHAAVVVERGGGEGELAAYLVSSPRLDVDEVRAHLARALPEYMIPSRFARVDDLPRTVSGKLDRQALAASGAAVALDVGSAYAPPASDAERALVAVWQTVLGRDRVGIDDNYFSLGGDSIKAIQVLSRLRRQDLNIEIRDLFRHPTIRSLAPHVVGVGPPEPRINGPEASGRDLPLTAIQARFFAEHTVERERFNHTLLLHARGTLDADAVREVFSRVRDQHDSLRLTFHEPPAVENGGHGTRGVRVQRVAPTGGARIALEVVDLRGSRQPAEEIEARAAALQQGFDLARGPLMTLALFRRDDGDRLLIAIHHLAIDAVSWRILFEELAEGYAQAAAGHPVRLAPTTDSFASFTLAMERYSRSASLGAERGYWEEIEASATPLRGVDAAPPARYGDLERLRVLLPADETAALLTDANRAYTTTPEDLLLTALARALDAWRGSSGTVIALEGHGRHPVVPGVDVSRTTGWFTSVHPFALALAPGRDVGYQVKSLKDRLRAVPGHGVGYGVLRYVTPPAGGGRPALALRPEINFNYLGRLDPAPASGLFTLASERLPGGVSDEAECPADVDVSGIVIDGRLELTLGYHRRRFEAEAMRKLLDVLDVEVRTVIAHCRGRTRTELTPADLTYSALSLDELEDLFS